LDGPPKADYDATVRQAVLDRLLRDRLNVEPTKAALQRDFLVTLSDGFVYDCLRWQLARLDLAPHRRLVLQRFSGTLCVDELHWGDCTLLLATDPLADLPVGLALVGANNQEHRRRFLHNLARWGLRPGMVVSDGSNLYPGLLAEIWPGARHQLCVFHPPPHRRLPAFADGPGAGHPGGAGPRQGGRAQDTQAASTSEIARFEAATLWGENRCNRSSGG
jgi:hypothetical protein